MLDDRIELLPPREGHSETGACVCHVCSSNMRLIGVEPHPLRTRGDLFTYECVCGELHTTPLRLQAVSSSGFVVEVMAC